MDFIRTNELPDIAAKKAFNAGYYIEAIQILHGFIENQAQSLLMLVGAVHFNSEQEDIWDMCDTIKFPTILKTLYILNQISKEEYQEFTILNSLRNKVIHQLYKEPYDKPYDGIPRKEYENVFYGILDKVYFFTRKTEEIIEI